MHITLKNTSEISIKKLKELQKDNNTQITIQDSETSPNSSTYPIYKFIQIKEKINQYISGIPNIPQTDPNREKKIFTYLYLKMGQNIRYDEKAAMACGLTGYDRDAADWLITSAGNLERRFIKWNCYLFRI